MFLFKPKKPEEEKKPEVSQANIDLEIITNMNQEFALSLELKETLNTALKVIINRINAQAANIFLINVAKFKEFQYKELLIHWNLLGNSGHSGGNSRN